MSLENCFYFVPFLSNSDDFESDADDRITEEDGSGGFPFELFDDVEAGGRGGCGLDVVGAGVAGKGGFELVGRGGWDGVVLRSSSGLSQRTSLVRTFQ